eukprot:3910749-Pleurochrysis_carterae.AAC.3
MRSHAHACECERAHGRGPRQMADIAPERARESSARASAARTRESAKRRARVNTCAQAGVSALNHDGGRHARALTARTQRLLSA